MSKSISERKRPQSCREIMSGGRAQWGNAELQPKTSRGKEANFTPHLLTTKTPYEKPISVWLSSAISTCVPAEWRTHFFEALVPKTRRQRVNLSDLF